MDTSTPPFHFDLVSPERLLFSDAVQMVVIPGSEGDFGVLAGHMPFISTLRPGLIEIHTATHAVQRMFTTGGVAEVANNHCSVLAEETLDLSDVNAGTAMVRVQEAREALIQARETENPVTVAAAEKALRAAEALADVVKA